MRLILNILVFNDKFLITEINVNIDGKRSSFSIPGILNVKLESFLKPVTWEEQDTRIQLPRGFIWKLSEGAKTKIMNPNTKP
jgi:hypothetical protein